MALVATSSSAVPTRPAARAQRATRATQPARRVQQQLPRSEIIGSWSSSTSCNALRASAVVAPRAAASAPRQVTKMGNANTTGPFAPLVRVARGIMGQKTFNSIRGQAIAYHSQVIRAFIGRIGGDNKMIQGLIKKAKKNGERLGFLA